jgi:hypothetical protein
MDSLCCLVYLYCTSITLAAFLLWRRLLPWVCTKRKARCEMKIMSLLYNWLLLDEKMFLLHFCSPCTLSTIARMDPIPSVSPSASTFSWQDPFFLLWNTGSFHELSYFFYMLCTY